VYGTANIAGSVVVTASSINFNPTFTNATSGSETGDFSGLTGGTIQSLTGGPVTGAVNIPQFVEFNQGVAQTVYFDLTDIVPGAGASVAKNDCTSGALASECTPSNSPFLLIQIAPDSVVVGMELDGVAYTGSSSSGGSSYTLGTFSTQVNGAINGTIPEILNTLAGGGSVSATYSATFNSVTTPEPASLLLLGVGLLGAGLVARRKSTAK
jgi:hypothetical protein